ncbi:MAG: hypothetical protein Q7V19_06800 [Bacteroidales bacterium]|nr:hypothetical protein [Bacteroidales bacterium]MDP2237844.1 hypothetical protein [Bacteroidales bacterium]
MIILSIESFYHSNEGLMQTIAIIVAIILGYYTIFKPLYDYIKSQKNQRRDKRFETYHKLIDILVGAKGAAMLDRQITIVYEFRNFPEYYKVTKRILTGLKQQWNVQGNTAQRLIDEIDITIEFIDSNYFKRKLCFKK